MPGLLDDYLRQQRNQRFFATLGRLGSGLLAAGGAGQGTLPGLAMALNQPMPQSSPMNDLLLRREIEKEEERKARGSRYSEMVGGLDPQSGIDWQTGRMSGGTSPQYAMAAGGGPTPQAAGLLSQPQPSPLLEGMTPQQTGILRSLDPGTGMGILAERAFDEPKSERGRTRQALDRMGYDTAKIDEFFTNRDRYQFTQDMFGNRMVFDRYTGKPAPGRLGPPQTALTAQSAPAPTPTPQAAPGPVRPADAPAGGYEQATGPSGFVGNLANIVTDAAGLPLAAPEVDRAKNAMTTLQNRTELFLTASVPGRESNQVRARLRELTVTPGSIIQGDQRSLNRLQETRAFIDEEITRIEGLLQNPVGVKATELSAARTNWGQLIGLRDAYDRIIGGFKPAGKPAPSVGFVKGGYRFKGGNPADPNSWEKIQ